MDCSDCGFEVSADVQKLLGEVESAFGRDIPLRRLDPGHRFYRYGGTTKLNADDVAILCGGSWSLYDLAHELLHLKRYCSGIPLAVFNNPQMLQLWTSKVENYLEHHAIFPALAEMQTGVDPYRSDDEQAALRSFRDLCEGTGGDPRDRRINIALAAWQVHLTKKDKALLREYDEAARKSDKKAHEMSRTLLETVEEHGIKTASAKATVLQNVRRTLALPWRGPLEQIVPTGSPKGPWFTRRTFGKL